MMKTVRLGFAAAQNYGKKHFATAVKATKELKAKVKIPNTSQIKSTAKGISSKVSTRYKKLPESYKTGIKVSAIVGGMALSPKLKKNDPRYKALKKHGYV
jgi:transglutaminase/protease-like cytokinesis protein 3